MIFGVVTVAVALAASRLAGTRSSTALLIAHDGDVEMVERRFDAQGVEIATARFCFSIEPAQISRPSPAIMESAVASG